MPWTRSGASFTDTPGPNNTGHYRNPLPMSDGTLVAVHTSQTNLDGNDGNKWKLWNGLQDNASR